MKRSIKNIIMIVLFSSLLVVTYFTMSNVSTNHNLNQMLGNGPVGETGQMGGLQGGTPPNMNNSSESNDNQMTPPDQNSKNSSTNSNSQTPPEKPDGDNNNKGAPPDMNNNSQIQGNMPSMKNNESKTISTKSYILFGAESLGLALILIYLLMSEFNKIGIKQVLLGDKLVIFLLLTIIFTGVFIFCDHLITKRFFINNESNIQNKETSSEAKGTLEISDTQKLSGKTYKSSDSDTNAILIKKGGNATLDKITVNKTGDSTNTESSDFSGVNAGILANDSGIATITNSTINTNAKGANGVFATGTNSKITISDSTITTKGEASSRGLDATYGGTIIGSNLKITTQGASSATLATDRGEGTVTVDNSDLETNGAGSPIIYSTGNISIDNTKGDANGSQMVVIEGKNSATITNSILTASGKGNRNDVDNAGIMIYQSMSGDASEGTGTFSSTDSSLSIQESSSYYKTAPFFFITNTDAIINLENTEISYGSNILINAKGTTEWGNSGSNGGNVELNAKNQSLIGNIEIDNLSTLTMNLSSSTYEGTINSDNNAKSITLKLDKNSKITLTGDSYITSLDNEDSSNSNIDFNGYKLYVNGKAIN